MLEMTGLLLPDLTAPRERCRLASSAFLPSFGTHLPWRCSKYSKKLGFQRRNWRTTDAFWTTSLRGGRAWSETSEPYSCMSSSRSLFLIKRRKVCEKGVYTAIGAFQYLLKNCFTYSTDICDILPTGSDCRLFTFVSSSSILFTRMLMYASLAVSCDRS